jgi:thiamine pyrophosphokinase
MPRAILFVNGDLPDLTAARSLLRAGDIFIAADGGTHHADALGAALQVLIGDLDSVTAEDVSRYAEKGVKILRFPPAKDETDLELALQYAIGQGYAPILLLGALGGRLDQQLGNLSLLADPALRSIDIRLDDGLTEAFFITERAEIHGQPGDTVSLLPFGLPAEGIVTEALAYPLRGETLHPHRTRGISNEMLSEKASVTFKGGLLLCIHIRKKPFGYG